MVDARGYGCPTPVIMVQKEVKKNSPATLEVLVDNPCSMENVTRFGKSQGYDVAVEQQGTDYKLMLKK